MCECHQIGGPWIAEDPDCPAHGAGGLQEQLDHRDDEIILLTRTIANQAETIKNLEHELSLISDTLEVQRQAGYL